MHELSSAARWGRAAVSIPVLALSLDGASSAALAARPNPAAVTAAHKAVPPARFPIRNTGIRPNLRSGQTYTIVSVGAPSSKTYTSSQPFAFNNTGQIFGVAYDSKKEYTADCVLYTGTAFVDVSAPTNDASCSVGGLSNAVSGTVHFVGALNTPFNEGSVAFSGALATATGKGALHPYTTNSSSRLIGVNSGGEAFGNAYYAPLSGFYAAQPDFVLPAGKTALEVGQPQCTTPGQYCDYQYYVDAYSCPFGGCSINDSGLILGYDEYAAVPSLLTYTYGQSSSAKDIAITGSYPYSYAFLNNAGQIAYSSYNSSESNVASYVYSGANGTTTAIPSIPGNTCAYYLVLSLSNAGQVLGQTASCGSNSDYVYFTWDPVNGTQNLNAEINMTGYSYVYPLGVNDNGQILVQLYPTTGGSTWGTLNPPAAALRHGRQSLKAASTHG